MFGWPLACEIMPGAKAQNIAPTQAASRARRSVRDRTKYQLTAVAMSARSGRR